MIFKVPIISDMLFYPMVREENYIYSCADKIVGVSKTYCERARKVNKKNAECIPVFLGTKLDLFDKYVQENRIERNDDRFIIGYCGTLGHSYDIKCVLDAMIRIRNNGYDNISLWIMGDGPLKKDFEKYALDNQLDVVFYGRIQYPQMCGLIASCDACVNPIIGLSRASVINKHGDYAASGIPVINSQESPEYRQLIEEWNMGFNVKCEDPSDMTEKIACLIEDRSLCSEKGIRARACARAMFDRSHSYLQIIEAVES